MYQENVIKLLDDVNEDEFYIKKIMKKRLLRTIDY